MPNTHQPKPGMTKTNAQYSSQSEKERKPGEASVGNNMVKDEPIAQENSGDTNDEPRGNAVGGKSSPIGGHKGSDI